MQKLLEMLQKIKSKASATATGVNFNDISIIAIYIEQLRIESEGYLLDTSLTEDVKVEKKNDRKEDIWKVVLPGLPINSARSRDRFVST